MDLHAKTGRGYGFFFAAGPESDRLIFLAFFGGRFDVLSGPAILLVEASSVPERIKRRQYTAAMVRVPSAASPVISAQSTGPVREELLTCAGGAASGLSVTAGRSLERGTAASAGRWLGEDVTFGLGFGLAFDFALLLGVAFVFVAVTFAGVLLAETTEASLATALPVGAFGATKRTGEEGEDGEEGAEGSLDCGSRSEGSLVGTSGGFTSPRLFPRRIAS